MMSQRLNTTDLAGIQYLGIDGVTSSCLRAITLLLHGGEIIEKAKLITCDGRHAVILSSQFKEVFVIKAGFTSGYPGEGPHGLATALALLTQHNADIEEYAVNHDFIHRIDASCLLKSDLDWLESASPIRPRRWYDYQYAMKMELTPSHATLAQHYPLAVPFHLIDARIMEFAVAFQDDEDRAIMATYRRLEDVVRDRTGIMESGVKLFSRAFLAEDAPLTWDLPDDGERKGRGNLFVAVYMAFRNARMHREPESHAEAALREFLLVNELFRLEADAVERAHTSTSSASFKAA